MKQEAATHGDAYLLVKQVYDKSPGRRWRRLNGALRETLSAAIAAHLSFLPIDFAAMMRDMNGGYWMGNSVGSVCGEGFYTQAVKVGHTPACVSFEQYAGRPAALWSESVKTPERLRIGSEFTWGGAKFTVTNIKDDRLIACSYAGHQYRGHDADLAIGQFEHLHDGKYRSIEDIQSSPKGDLSVRFSAPMEDPYRARVSSVVKITFDELFAVRSKYDVLRRKALKDIAAALDLDSLAGVSTELAKGSAPGTYRHFDVEDFRAAITAREKALGLDREEQRRIAAYARRESEDLERWANGGERRYFQAVRLRVSGERVETSTGQSATVESVRRALPIILRRRQSFGPVRNLSVDSYPVVEQSVDGVKVGCTLIPWAEVERLAEVIA